MEFGWTLHGKTRTVNVYVTFKNKNGWAVILRIGDVETV